MDLTFYNTTATSVNDTGSDHALMTGMMVTIAFALGTASMIENCSYESPPSSPKREVRQVKEPPPAPKKRARNDEETVELESKILSYLASHPGATGKEMTKSFGVEKTIVNSRLYSLLYRKRVRKVGETGAPQWFLTLENSLAIVPHRG